MAHISAKTICLKRTRLVNTRLLNVRSLEHTVFSEEDVPPYVIASHRWTADEARFDVFKRQQKYNSRGYIKVKRFCELAQRIRPEIQWLWIDSCCIDKRDLSELSTAINSMFRWYANSVECFAYLHDADTEDEVCESTWFQRGWTLQELIAPRIVTFISSQWQVLGHKCHYGPDIDQPDYPGPSLLSVIADRTGIPTHVLCDPARRANFTVTDIFKWASKRTTTAPEDRYYSLLGILGVSMPANYGEGIDQARVRIHHAIHMKSQYRDYPALDDTQTRTMQSSGRLQQRRELDSRSPSYNYAQWERRIDTCEQSRRSSAATMFDADTLPAIPSGATSPLSTSSSSPSSSRSTSPSPSNRELDDREQQARHQLYLSTSRRMTPAQSFARQAVAQTRGQVQHSQQAPQYNQRMPRPPPQRYTSESPFQASQLTGSSLTSS